MLCHSLSNFRVSINEACRFLVESLVAAGANCIAAQQQAQVLIQADIYGHPSHGINRLAYCVNDIRSGACEPNNKPEILKQSPSTAWIDANNVLGATVSHMAMEMAICKAKNTGIGWVTVKGSNYNGMAGFWAQKAACRGLIGLAFTNTSPVMAPTRSKHAALGSNPIAVAAVGTNCELFYLDMSTTAVALGKIEMQRYKGLPLPAGWAQGPDGEETRDAEVAFKTMRLYPLGGIEKTSGYKGYGLAAMVEMFCGICAGSNYGHHVPMWSEKSSGKPINLGHCFGAIDPESFAPGFQDRLAESMCFWRRLIPKDPNVPVLAPGDKEMLSAYLAQQTGSIHLVQAQLDTCAAIAKKLHVMPMNILSK